MWRLAVLGTLLLGHSFVQACVVDYDLNKGQLHVPCIKVGEGVVYQADFELVDPIAFIFSLNGVSPATPTDLTDASVYDVSTNQLTLTKLSVRQGSAVIGQFKVILQSMGNNQYGITNVLPLSNNSPTGENQQPVASDLSLQANQSLPYQEISLIGKDADNDTLAYELVSASQGLGYELAYINPLRPKLYVTLANDFNGEISLQYRVTDGQIFSEPATVTLTVAKATEDGQRGLDVVTAKEYADFQSSRFKSDLLGAPDAVPSLPKRVDLSSQFPKPANQGQQNSCVGWATAYAVKSYQEGVEFGWALNTSEHLFSPAFIYNQINGGKDKGSRIDKALDLVVEKGVATLATMPYSDKDFLTQPSSQALTQALGFKGAEWVVPRGLNDIKAALANKYPVVAGIFLYESFYRLKGADSVYNTIQGNPLGGHAVAVVGYDDDKYGGALRIINSHGANWGDNGYFWLPYDFMSAMPRGNNNVPPIFMQAFVLKDKDNTVAPPTDNVKKDTIPAPVGELPNLVVQDWNLNYDPKPNGLGRLTYNVVNSGKATATKGANISLLLSVDAIFSTNDMYIVYEPIPFDLPVGQKAFRDEANAIQFNLPSSLKNGEYYVALWVDDRDVLLESNERDNLSLSNNKVAITSTLPDLMVHNWYAEWDSFGNALLTYRINNEGASALATTDWDISLVLSRDTDLNNGDEILLFLEKSQFALEAGQYIYRDNTPAAPAAPFSVVTDMQGNRIPAGNYYIALWVDLLQQIEESDETNNTSLSTATTLLGTRGNNQGRVYNGKTLKKPAIMRKIRISDNANGERQVQMLGETEDDENPIFSKTIGASDKLIFPIEKGIEMPQ